MQLARYTIVGTVLSDDENAFSSIYGSSENSIIGWKGEVWLYYLLPIRAYILTRLAVCSEHRFDSALIQLQAGYFTKYTVS